jgi:hypothetical protein
MVTNEVLIRVLWQSFFFKCSSDRDGWYDSCTRTVLILISTSITTPSSGERFHIWGFNVCQLGCVVLKVLCAETRWCWRVLCVFQRWYRNVGRGAIPRCSVLLGNKITILGHTILEHDKDVRALMKAREWADAGARELLFNPARGTTLSIHLDYLSCE